ncbi:unnamed protein product [Effrenium voratum]|nr:unnamed protein product [Effrenium voratum]
MLLQANQLSAPRERERSAAMAIPGQPAEPAMLPPDMPGLPGFMASIDLRLARLSEQIATLMERKAVPPKVEDASARSPSKNRSDELLSAVPIPSVQTSPSPSRGRSSVRSAFGEPERRLAFEDEDRSVDASVRSYQPARVAPKRRPQPLRSMDLRTAWQLHTQSHGSPELSSTSPPDTDMNIKSVLRFGRSSDWLWELLDDPNSSNCAAVVSTVLKVLVILSMVMSQLRVAEIPSIEPFAASLVDLAFDSIFGLEFLCRILSAPSKARYLADPLNWADLLTACALPLHIAELAGADSQALNIVLLFFVPLARLLKLLRYFEVFRLLIVAFRSSASALPVLFYFLCVIVLISASAIYLVESRSNIPSMNHSLWLAVVTITTVGYGDYFPKSLPGYVIVSFLTLTSVLFLALPVGIIGNEFTACWQSRTQVLLTTRARKCMQKWGYTASQVRMLFEYVDLDHDGTLSISEFMELMRQMRIGIGGVTAFELFTLPPDLRFERFVASELQMFPRCDHLAPTQRYLTQRYLQGKWRDSNLF